MSDRELADALVALQASQDDAVRARWNRSLPLADELFDRLVYDRDVQG